MPFAWVASPSTPIHANPFRPKDTNGMNIATHSAPSTLHAVVESWLSTGGAKAQSLSTSNSLALIARLVAAGHAIAILPLPLLQEMLATGVVRTLPCTPRIEPAGFFISYLTAAQSSGMDAIVQLARDTLLRLNFLTSDRSAHRPA
jgi:DNA-binding transcriptional LysR family regulator